MQASDAGAVVGRLAAAALNQPEWAGVVRLFIDEGPEVRSEPVGRYIGGLDGGVRARLVVVTWPWPDPAGGALGVVTAAPDIEVLKDVADFYGVPVHVAAGLRVSPRRVVAGAERRTSVQRGSVGLEDCVTRVRGYLDEVYPGGVRLLRSVDDILVGSAGVAVAQARLVAGPGWAEVHSLDRLEAAVGVAEAGSTAVVLVSYQGDELGHALVLAKTGSGANWLDPTVAGFAAYPVGQGWPRAVRRAAKVWAVVLDGRGRVTEPDTDTWAAAESSSMSYALRDAPLILNRRFGAQSFEAEFRNFEIVGSGPSPNIPYDTVLASGNGVEVKTDHHTVFDGVDGRYYGTRDELDAAGVRLLRTRSATVPEVVVTPWAVGDEPDRPSRQEMDAAFLDVIRILYHARVITGPFDGQGTRLADLFRNTPYQVNPAYQDARVSHLEQTHPGAFIYLQQTVGVPMDALFQFLKDVAPETTTRYGQKDTVEAGISFGRVMGQRYVQERFQTGIMPGEDEVEALAGVYWPVNRLMGFMTLTYIHAAALLFFQINLTPTAVGKHHLPVASRNSLRSGWAGLGTDLQAFLRANADAVKTALVRHFLNRFTGFKVLYHVAVDLRPQRTDPATMAALHHQHANAAQAQITAERLLNDPIRDTQASLSNVLDEVVHPGDQPRIFSVGFGVTASDRGDELEQLAGPVPLALIVLELRYWGQDAFISPIEMRRRIDAISGYARQAYGRAPYLLALAGTAEGQYVYRSVRTAATTPPRTTQRTAAVTDVQNAVHRYLQKFPAEHAHLEAALTHAIRVFGVQVPVPPPAGVGQLAGGSRRSAGLYPPMSWGLRRSPIGQPTAVPVGLGPVVQTRLDRVRLDGAVRDTARDVGSGTDQTNCVALLDGLKDRFYPTGVRVVGFQDDLALGAGRPGGTLIPGATWDRVPSWDELHRAVSDAGPGATAFVLLGRPSGIGHGFAMHHLVDGMVVRVDVQAVAGRQIVEGLADLEPVAAARAVVVDGTGRVVDKAFASVVESAGPVRGQVDAPTDPRFGMSRERSDPDPVDQALPDPPAPVDVAPVNTSATPGAVTRDVESRPRDPRRTGGRRFSEDSLTPRERQIWDSTYLTAAEQAGIAPDRVARSQRQRRITVILNRRRDLIETERLLRVAQDARSRAPEGQFSTVAARQESINAALEAARRRWNTELRVPLRPAGPMPPADLLAEVRQALGHETQRGAMYMVGSPRDIRTERQVYLDLAMDRVGHPRIRLTDEQHREWDHNDAEAALERVSILAAAERRLAATVEGGEVETATPEPGSSRDAGGPPRDGLSDREWWALDTGRLRVRRRMGLTISPEQHQRAGRREVRAQFAEIRRLSRVLEDLTGTDPVPEARRRGMFDPIEPIASGRPLTRSRPTRPGRQLFRTVLATGRRELVTLAAHDEHHWPTGGRRLGVAADLDVDPVSTSEAPEMPVGINPRTNTDTSNVEEVEAPIQYEYYTVDRVTRLSTKEVLDPRERIHETKPLGGYEPGYYAHRHGRRVPVGKPRARVLTYDEGTGRWDVVPMDTWHISSPPVRDADGRPIAADPAAAGPATSTDYQVLRRGADGRIDLLTYRRAPEVAPGTDGPGGIHQYHRLDGPGASWHAGTVPGFPTTTTRLEGTVAGQTSVALVRDTDTGLWQPVTTGTADSAPSETPTAPAPRTFHRLNQATGNLEDLPVKAIRLDVLELDLETGAVTPAAFAASTGTDTGELALDPLNNLVVPPATEFGALRFDPDTRQIGLHPSDGSGGGGGTFGGLYRPGDGDRWSTARHARSGGSRVVTRRVTTTFTRTTDSSAGWPEGDIPTPVADDASTRSLTPQASQPQPAPRPRRTVGRWWTMRPSMTTTRVPPRVTRMTTLPRRVDEPLAGVLDPGRARTALASFNRVLVTHRGVEPNSLPRLSRTMTVLSTQLNRPSVGDGPVAGRPLADGMLGRAVPAGTGAPAADPPPLAWGRAEGRPLSSEAAAVLDRRGLQAVAADESGGVLGTVLSSGVLHRIPGMRALTAGAATVSPDSIAGMLLAERAGGGWPLLGLSIVDQATDRAVAEWIAAGLPVDAVPEPVRRGPVHDDGEPRPGAEVLVHLAATLAGRPVVVVRSDGSQVRYGPDATEPPMVLVADRTGILLATVPRDAVPTVLAAEPAQVLRPGTPDDPTTVLDDARSLDGLGQVLATIAGVESLPLPDPDEWAAGLRTQLVGGDSVEPHGDPSGRADATLDGTLAVVRDALSDPLRTPAPPHTSWPGVIHQPGDPNVLNPTQATMLRRRRLAAVWTRPDGNSLFEAVRLTGQHGPARLGNIGAVPAASLRSAFGALIRDELGRRGESPLTAAERSDRAVGRAAVLDFAARLATPTGVLYPETPHLLGRTMTAVFGVDVEIIGPDGTPHRYQAPGQHTPHRPLTLVMDANGHVMATVPVSAYAGTVRLPGSPSVDPPGPLPDSMDPQAILLVPATDAYPSVFLEPPSDSDDGVGPRDLDPSGSDFSDRDLSGGHASDRESTDREWTTDRDSLEYATDPGSGDPDGGRPGADGQPPPIDPVLPPLVLPPADSTVHSIGIPRGTLPHVDEVVDQLRAAAVAAGRPIAERQLAQLAERLSGNYRQVAGGGHLVTVDGVELLITMAPSDPRFVPNPAGSYDLVAPGPDRDAEVGRETSGQGRFRANQSTHGAFNTGGVSQSHTGQGTSLRGRLAVGFGFGVAPGVLQVGKFGGVISGTANESSWATSQFKDAESGRVEDNRADSTLIAYRPNWTVQMRSDPAQAWNNVAPVWRSRGANQHPLLVYLPDHYLGDPGPQVTAHDPDPDAAGAAEFRTNRTRLPDTYFASGLIGLPELYDNVANQVQAGGVPMPLDSPMRDELRQKLWKLDANLGAAINGDEGYRITLHDKHGQPVAVVHVRTTRLAGAERAGTTSNVSHLERVRTAIVGQSAGHTLKNESGVQVSGGVDLAPVPGLSLGLSAYLGWTWTNTDTTNAGRTGLWVLVSRYSGHTGGYTMPLRHQATVSTVTRPTGRPVATGAVDGTALVRLPEPAAHSHGLPVDARAVDDARPNQPRIPYRPGATRDTGERRATGGVLPRHVYAGRGIGMGLARVDDAAVTRLQTRVMAELRERGFLPPDADRPFHQPTGVDDQVMQNMQLANLDVVTKFVSGDGLDSHFDQSLQDGLPFTLTVLGPNGKLRSARVTINAHQDLAEVTPIPASVTDPEQSPNSRYYQRRTGEYQLVNLAIGTGSGGTRTGGGQRFSAGGRATLGTDLLKGLGTGLEYQRSVGAGQGVGFVVNRPELLEYPGDVDEFALPTDYVATIEYDDGTPTMRHDADPVRATVTVQLIPGLNTGIADAGPAATAARPTPRRVIDQAVVYHLDTTGLVDAARTLQPRLTGVGATSDEEVNNFAGQILQRSFLKEALGHQLQTNQLFESGLLADRHGALAVSADLGASVFVGATKGQFTLGLIKLWLAQASHSSSRGAGITWDQLDLALHGDPGPHSLTDLTGEIDQSVHLGWNRSTSMSRTGGKELLELDFHRAYAFATTVDFTVEGIRERAGKLVPAQVQHGAVPVNGRDLVYLLAEPEALAAYAAGDVPISLAQLRDALNRWQNGELTLSNDLVERILVRLRNDHGPGDADLQAWLGGITETVEDGHRDALRAALIKAGLDTPDNLWFAPYLTRTGPRALGHSGVHDFTFNDGSNIFDLVHGAVEEAAPGLLGVRQQDWAQRVHDIQTQVWYRKAVPGGRSMVGRVPGGLDFLQSIMSGGREQAMFEDMLGEHGLSFDLVNPIADTLADAVRVNLQLRVSSPRVADFVGGTGLENYGHAYASQTTGTSRDSTRTWTLPKVGLGGAHHTSGGPELHVADGHHDGVNQTTQNTEEQTVYDWTGEYRFDLDSELQVTVTRLDMVGRPVNNTLTRGYRWWAGHTEPVEVRRAGNLVLRVPRGLAEAQPLQGPDPVIDTSALPRLPGDSYITAALVDDALPAAEALLARVLGPVADDPRFRSSISLPVLLSRSQLTNHLTKALAGREHLLVDDMFVPGNSSDRVSMWLSGDLYNLRVLAPIVNATGTGRYAKHQSGTNAFSNHDRLRPSVVGGLDQSAQTHLNDPANPTQPWATDTFDASSSANRVAPRGVNDAATDNYRNETHIKQQGEVFLVEANVVLRLAAERATYNPLLPTRHQDREYGEPFTGTVFLEMFADEVVELRARMTATNAVAVAADDPATWPRTDPRSPRFRLDQLLIDAGRQTGDVRRAPSEAARHIQSRLNQPGPIVMTSQPGRRAFEAYTAVRAWAPGHLATVDPAAAARVHAEQADELRLHWQLSGTGPVAPADVAQTWTRIWDLVREVNAHHTTPVELPPEVAAAGLDVVHAARQVARNLGRHIQLEDVDHVGRPVVYRIDPTGRVYRLDDLGEPLPAADAYAILLDELNRVSAHDHNGRPVNPEHWQGRRLDEGRVRARIDDIALDGLYRNSWSRGQTFEQAIRGAIADHDRAVAEAMAPVDLGPPPPADPDTRSVRSRRPRPREGSFAESDRGEVLARMASVRRRHAGHRPGEGTVDSDPESDEESPGPHDARLPDDTSLDVPRRGARRRLGPDSPREVSDVGEVPLTRWQLSMLSRYPTQPGTGLVADNMTIDSRTSIDVDGYDDMGFADSSIYDAPLPPLWLPPVDSPAGLSSMGFPLSEGQPLRPPAQEPGESPVGASLPVVRTVADVQPFQVPAPAGTRYEGPVLVVESGNAWRGNGIVARIADAARSARRPVIAINLRGDLAPDGPEMTALTTALHRYRWFGVPPVVVATGDTPAFAAVRDRYRPVTIQLASAGLDDAWTLRGPDGTRGSTWASLGHELFAAADAVPVRPDGRALPPVLAGLLAQNTWPEGEQYLRDNVTALRLPHIEEALRDLREDEPGPEDQKVGAYQVIMRLLRTAGGVAPPSEPRFNPATPTSLFDEPLEVGMTGPLRETFAFDYLSPLAAVQQGVPAMEARRLRKPWDDRLLQLMDLGALSTHPGLLSRPETAALARGLSEVGERRGQTHDYGLANASVFRAIADVLGIEPETARLLEATTNPVAMNETLSRAVGEIESCALDPSDRVAWLTRINHLRTRLDQPAYRGFLEILTHTLAQC